jgi:hypothetical protein
MPQPVSNAATETNICVLFQRSHQEPPKHQSGIPNDSIGRIVSEQYLLAEAGKSVRAFVDAVLHVHCLIEFSHFRP